MGGERKRGMMNRIKTLEGHVREHVGKNEGQGNETAKGKVLGEDNDGATGGGENKLITSLNLLF